jgi:ferrochelatase
MTSTDATGVGQLDPYDAVLLVSFGGPEKPADVLPFLQNVTHGRGVPPDRLAEVAEHYYHFGGRSPINDQCRRLLAALWTELDRRGIGVPLFWGNRNWNPYLADTAEELVAGGHRRVLALTTSAYPSYSSCRQYREDLYDAVADRPLTIDRIRHYATHPGFVTATVDAALAALDALGDDAARARLIFVTHSIPAAMAATAGPEPRTGTGAYVDWHAAVAVEVTRRVERRRGIPYGRELAYCSRSGPPQQPWLEPDIVDRLSSLKAAGCSGVVVVPIGFVSDHMEVIFDLDTEAARRAAELGLGFARAATAGTHPAFVEALADLLCERAAVARGEPGWHSCQPTCCPNLRDPNRPSLCQLTTAASSGNSGRSLAL